VAAYLAAASRRLIMRIVDIQLSFPAILIALILLAVLGQGVGKIIAALVAVQWAYYARTVRARGAGRAAQGIHRGGALPGAVGAAHRVPPPAAELPAAADRGGHRAGGARSRWRPRCPSWAWACRHRALAGLLIANGFQYLMSGKYWISFFPGVALLVTIVCHQPGRRPAARRAQPAAAEMRPAAGSRRRSAVEGLRPISHARRRVKAVDGVSLRRRSRGEILGLVGESGSGKSSPATRSWA
jgi:hypothetical protein